MIALRLLEIYFWILQLQIHTEIQAIIQFILIHRPQFGLLEERLKQVYIQRGVYSGRECGVGVQVTGLSLDSHMYSLCDLGLYEPQSSQEGKMGQLHCHWVVVEFQ